MDGFRERRIQMQKEWMEKATQLEWIGDITMEQVKEHNTKKDMWVVLDGYVYDLTQYIFNHPGGSNCFTTNIKDITNQFMAVHPHVDSAIIEKLKIGKLVDESSNSV